MEKADVQKIQKFIEEKQKREIQLKTKLEGEYETAKKEFKIESIEAIDEKLDEIDKEMSSIEKKIDRKTKTLEENYPWDI